MDSVTLHSLVGDYLKGGGGADVYVVKADDLGPLVIDLDNDGSVRPTGVPRLNKALSGPNLIANGDFESGFSNGVANGWSLVSTETMEWNTPGAYRMGAEGHGNTIVEMDNLRNTAFQQSISGLHAGEEVVVEFDYGRRPGSTDDGGLALYWNDTLVWSTSRPKGEWDRASVTLTVPEGMNINAANILKFVGTGTNDTAGVLLDNVSMRRQNLIVNGNFEALESYIGPSRTPASGVTGWAWDAGAPGIDIGWLQTFGKHNSGDLSKDYGYGHIGAHLPGKVRQDVAGLKAGVQYRLELDYAGYGTTSPNVNGINVWWNGKLLTPSVNFTPDDRGFSHLSFLVTAEATTDGLNRLELDRALPGWELVVDNVELSEVVGTLSVSDDPVNLIRNGDFENGTTGWTYDSAGMEVWAPTALRMPATAGHGNGAVDLDASRNSRISQQITGLAAGSQIKVSFDYGRRPGTRVDNGIAVYWNGQLVFSDDKPMDGWMHQDLVLTVAAAGANSNILEFRGTGHEGDYEGTALDNVSAYAYAGEPVTSDALMLKGTGLSGRNLLFTRSAKLSTAPNLLVNGDFEGSGGWTAGLAGIESNYSASSYGLSTVNHGNRVAELDVAQNTTLSQTITGKAGELFTLDFDYAMRTYAPAGNGIAVYWNGELVFVDGNPVNEWISHRLTLNARDGDNVLSFSGIGVSDGLGVVIDNANLYRSNLIANGNFEDGTSGWSYDANGIEVASPTGLRMTGAGHGSGAVDLDNARNSRISQKINGLQSGDHVKVSFDYGRRPGTDTDNGIEVYWNGQLVFSDASPADSWKTQELTLTAVADGSGKNVLEFRGTGKEGDYEGVALDNVQAVRQDVRITRLNNVVAGGDFESTNPSWDLRSDSSKTPFNPGVGGGVLALKKFNSAATAVNGLVAGEKTSVYVDYLSTASSTEKLKVYWNDNVIGQLDLSEAGVWKTARFTVTATGGDDRLSFDNWGETVKLDNVEVYAGSVGTSIDVMGFGSNQSDDLAVLLSDDKKNIQNASLTASNVNQLIQASAGFGSTDAWMSATDAQINGYGTTFNTILGNAPKLVA
ncbi:MAG: hypothetical protein ACLGJC_07035 [Alphaproteobacteria bacterium]